MLGNNWGYFFACGVVGIVLSIAIVYITQYYTAGSYRPVREIAKASETGPATNIITGISVGMETTAAPVIAIAVALLTAYGWEARPPRPERARSSTGSMEPQ